MGRDAIQSREGVKLIVTLNAGLVQQWANEIMCFTNARPKNIRTMCGSPVHHIAALDDKMITDDVEFKLDDDVIWIITTYNMLRVRAVKPRSESTKDRHVRSFFRSAVGCVAFGAVIFDEIHVARNGGATSGEGSKKRRSTKDVSSVTYEACVALVSTLRARERARWPGVIGLTGTPTVSGPTDLRNILSIVNAGVTNAMIQALPMLEGGASRIGFSMREI